MGDEAEKDRTTMGSTAVLVMRALPIMYGKGIPSRTSPMNPEAQLVSGTYASILERISASARAERIILSTCVGAYCWGFFRRNRGIGRISGTRREMRQLHKRVMESNEQPHFPVRCTLIFFKVGIGYPARCKSGSCYFPPFVIHLLSQTRA